MLKFKEALTRIRQICPNETLLKRSDWLSHELNANVYLKIESLQPGG